MILGFDFFGDPNSKPLKITGGMYNFNRIDLSNSIVDTFYIDSDATKVFSTTKDLWGYTTLLNAEFRGNLSAGNIDNGGVPIQQIKFRKRKTNTLEWTDIAVFTFDALTKIYTYIDNIVASATDYEYCIVPLTFGIMGNSVTQKITTSFDGTWVVDKNNGYKLLYSLQYSDIENVFPTQIIETYSQYPTILYSPVDYKKSTIKCAVFSSQTISGGNINAGTIDVQNERINRENMIKFFKQRHPFILKDFAGRYFMVALSNFKESPNNSMAQTISDISFDWCEIGDATDASTLTSAGLSI